MNWLYFAAGAFSFFLFIVWTTFIYNTGQKAGRQQIIKAEVDKAAEAFLAGMNMREQNN